MKILILFTLLIPQSGFSQINSSDFLPLQIGNTWIYHYSYGSGVGHGQGYDRYTINNTIQNQGKIYYTFSHERIVIDQYGTQTISESRLFRGDPSIRIDSISGNIYRNETCNSFQELLVDSLKASLGDSSFTCYNICCNPVRCIDTAAFDYFCNYHKPSKFFLIGNFEFSSTQRYLKDIGLISFTYNTHEACNVSLMGCVLNGIVYCDTSFITGIKTVSTESPNNFSLSQNYPNPFNPSTNIKFRVAVSSDTKLVIYNVLGKEVETLVNKKLDAGEYETNFDGINLPSGIYFYKLVTDDYTETKKMVLIK